MSKTIDMTGFVFGEMRVVGLCRENHVHADYLKSAPIWYCLCSCGQSRCTSAGYIRYRSAKYKRNNCGCKKSETFGQINRKPEGVSARNRILAQYKAGAKIRKHVWEITDEQFFSIVFEKCVYCDSEPLDSTWSRNPHGYAQLKVNGIDRVDPKIGYVISNCVPCCDFCNKAKGKRKLEDFEKWISRMLKFKCQV